MKNTTNSIQTLLKKSARKLEVISDSAFLDAELILAHCLGENRTYLHTWPEKILDNIQLNMFYNLIEKRLTDYPIAYMLGTKPFWTLDLIITTDVLIPRPETELLIEIALEKIKDTKNPKILDLGTGSGAIALALSSERPDANIIAVDYSEEALMVARKNAIELELDQQVSFIQSDWFDDVIEKDFDLIVSNPPYIDPEDTHLQGTIRHEPQKALIADKEGMSDIEIIIKKSHPFLKISGWLILEHGFDQSGKTSSLLSAQYYSDIMKYRDFNNNLRVTVAQKQY